MEKLRHRRTGDEHSVEEGLEREQKEESPKLVPDESFWEFKDSFEEFHLEFSPPEVNAAILKRLGEPSFWKSRKKFSKVFEPTYTACRQKD